MKSRVRIITALVAAGLLAPVAGAQTEQRQGQPTGTSTSTGQSQTTQPGTSGQGSNAGQTTPRDSASQTDSQTGSQTGSQTEMRSGDKQSSDKQSGTRGGATVSGADRKFMMEAAAGGMKEVELGRVAAQKATNPEIKQFAEKMVEEHTKANDELKSIAESKGVNLPAAPDARLQATLTKMQNLSGEEFDRAYLKEAGVKEHEKAEKLYRGQSTRGKDPETRAFAAKTLPTVQMHLTEVRGLEGSTSGTRTSSGTSGSGSTMRDGSHSSGSSTSGSNSGGSSSSGSSSGSGSGSGSGSTSNPSGQGSNTSTRPQ